MYCSRKEKSFQKEEKLKFFFPLCVVVLMLVFWAGTFWIEEGLVLHIVVFELLIWGEWNFGTSLTHSLGLKFFVFLEEHFRLWNEPLKIKLHISILLSLFVKNETSNIFLHLKLSQQSKKWLVDTFNFTVKKIKSMTWKKATL